MQKSRRVDEVALSVIFSLSINILLPFLFFTVWVGAIILYDDIFYSPLTFGLCFAIHESQLVYDMNAMFSGIMVPSFL